jgi:aspartate dehydrogenase
MKPPGNFGLIGCGAMGTTIAEAFDAGKIPGRLACVYDADRNRAQALAKKLKSPPEICPDARTLIEKSDFVVEAASQDAVKEHMLEAVRSGKGCLIMSVGALMDQKLMGRLKAESAKTGAAIHLPSGAIAGVDGLLSAACGTIEEVTLTTTKPPAGLKDVKYLVDKGIDVDLITQPTIVYDGTASEAVSLFPKNINVSAIVSIASGRNAKVRIIADPKAKTNVHEIRVRGSFGEITTRTSNVPSPANPKTSYLAALSAIAALKKITENVRAGN